MGGGPMGAHFGGGHFGGGHFAFRGGHFRPGFRGGIFLGAPYAYYGYSACYQRRPVPTPYGLVWARVWVCG
jgi:hypothetical protein